MSQPRQKTSPKLSLAQRSLLLLAGCGLLALLAVAASLQPDQRGLGTHQRLGLPPCSFRQLTGLRCPSCGMTTSWSHLVRGQAVSALRANVGGTVLGLMAMLLGPWSVICGLRGRWLLRPPGERVALAIVIGVLLLTLADWGVRMWLSFRQP